MNTQRNTTGPAPAAGTSNTLPQNTTTTTAGIAPATGNQAAHSTASGIKGVFAAVHGAGETLRGTVNSAVDETFSDSHGKVKNDAVTAEGIDEMTSGKFGASTKDREGVVPGASHGERRI